MATRKQIWNQYKGWIIASIVGGTFSFLVYIGTLIVQDTAWYHQEEELIEWYENKSKSFAVGLRVKKVEKDGEIIYKTVYKATNGETYPAVYNKKGLYWFYLNDEGLKEECH